MHPRNRYRENKPDFRDLAEYRASLRPYLIQKKTSFATEYPCTLDFSNSDALRELACAVLSKDFGLEVVLPADRLVPMVPQRLNYIHWLEDLLKDKREEEEEVRGEGERRRQVYGIDIGTGASCIYPLLGTVMNGWQFLATEVDEASVQSALTNVSRNNLQDRISVVKVATPITLIGAICENQCYDFVMCNPPFYEDKKERYEGNQRTSYRPPPQTFSTGAEGETVTAGGELGFVRRILHDSLILRTRIRWYTSMLGKKASVKVICQELKQHQVPVVVSTQFVQGRTHRWAVAWSFDETLEHKAKDSHTRPRKHSQVLTLEVHSEGETSEVLERVMDRLKTSLTELEIDFSVDESTKLVCEAHKNTWSQQRKRRRLRQKLQAQHQARPGDHVESACNKVTASGRNETAQVGVEKDGSNVRTAGSIPDNDSGGDLMQDMLEVESGYSDKAASTGDHAAKVSPLLSSGVDKECRTPELAVGSESPGSEQQDVCLQIEALNSLCYVQFSCMARLSSTQDKDSVSPPGKKMKLGTASPTVSKEESSVSLIFEWIQGDNKDLLHQIVQYLKNTGFR